MDPPFHFQVEAWRAVGETHPKKTSVGFFQSISWDILGEVLAGMFGSKQFLTTNECKI